MAANKPNILLLTTNLGLGGSQRVVRDHAAALAGHFNVTKAVFNPDGGDYFASGEEYISLDVAGGKNTLSKLLYFMQRVRRARSIKHRRSTNVCISHLEGADYVNVLSSTRDKVILCVHGSKLADANITGFWGWLRKSVLIPWLYNRADAIVTVSRDIIPELRELGVTRPRILTINNFFDVERIRAAAEEPLTAEEAALFDDGPILVTAGRFALQKNQAPLFDMLAALKARRPAKLVMLGDGELRGELVARARGLGLSVCEADRGAALDSGCDVYFMGSQRNPFKYFRRASLFLLPSSWEGFPMALCEAMACGLPVAASDCRTGPREILAPGTEMGGAIEGAERGPYGILVPIIDPVHVDSNQLNAWVDIVEELLGDNAERARLGEAARRRMEDFRAETIIPQWIALINDVAGRSSHEGK